MYWFYTPRTANAAEKLTSTHIGLLTDEK